MNNLARVLSYEQVLLEHGKVSGSEDHFFTVETSLGTLTAQKAVGCLVEPMPGDTVLVSQTASGKCYILSILEREDKDPVSLIFDGDVDLKAKDGRLRFAAQNGIDLVTAKDTTLVSAKLSVNSAKADVSIENLSFFGTFLQAQIAKIKIIGRTCDSVFERVSQSVKRSYRRVEELEQLNAGQLNYFVKKLMSLRGKYSVLTAEEDVRIDGDKILMG